MLKMTRHLRRWYSGLDCWRTPFTVCSLLESEGKTVAIARNADSDINAISTMRNLTT